jgi:hypothetical protein
MAIRATSRQIGGSLLEKLLNIDGGGIEEHRLIAERGIALGSSNTEKRN